MWGRRGLVILSGATATALAAAVFLGASGGNHVEVAHEAIRAHYGPSEHVLRRSFRAPCPTGYVGFAFLAQGAGIERPDGKEATGYVCSRHSRSPLVLEGPINPADHIDWD